MTAHDDGEETRVSGGVSRLLHWFTRLFRDDSGLRALLAGCGKAAGVGLPIPARLALELTGGRFPTRGWSERGVVVVVDEVVFFVAQEGDAGFVLYRLPMLSWYAELPGHVHTLRMVRVGPSSVRLCVFCGAQVGHWSVDRKRAVPAVAGGAV